MLFFFYSVFMLENAFRLRNFRFSFAALFFSVSLPRVWKWTFHGWLSRPDSANSVCTFLTFSLSLCRCVAHSHTAYLSAYAATRFSDVSICVRFSSKVEPKWFIPNGEYMFGAFFIFKHRRSTVIPVRHKNIWMIHVRQQQQQKPPHQIKSERQNV